MELLEGDPTADTVELVDELIEGEVFAGGLEGIELLPGDFIVEVLVDCVEQGLSLLFLGWVTGIGYLGSPEVPTVSGSRRLLRRRWRCTCRWCFPSPYDM